ncbi:MAG: META domain protein [Candidatus Accumulibacter sp. SK-11]|nr:MAG: META domain protein [Candidatus Accumulibacter sp. SK-11]HRL77087.1 META domain-containing protein [Candidatus Accumulibacter phosphatis]
MKRLFAFAAVLAAGIAQADGSPLAGTSWQLHAIQSMDDAQGTTKVAEPSHFTLEFGRDGRAALRLDCNRGSGDYKVAPAGDGSSGSLTFGPVATTRALCPPPHLDQRVARDLAHVRSYLLKDGKLYLSLMADGGIYEWAPQQAEAAAADNERVVKPVQFAKGKSSAVIRDRIVGYHYIDYQVRAGAGQRMTLSLKGSNGANYFNLLPPGSEGPAMVQGELLDNRFDSLLPDDGVYTIRVFLYRAAARRGEQSDFTLSVGVTGAPLKPVSAGTDAVLPGTRYHASTTVPCEPAFTRTRECEAFVVRRGFDGTATVELRWDGTWKRRILFVKGEPKAADVPQAMTFTRNERGWRVTFNGDEHFDIPQELVFGG